MEKKYFLATSVLGLLIFLTVGAWYFTRPDDGPSTTSATDTPSNGTLTGQTSGAVFEERRSVDLDAVTAEILNASDDDESLLDAEAASETEHFTEGAVLIENLGQSYDETEY